MSSQEHRSTRGDELICLRPWRQLQMQVSLPATEKYGMYQIQEETGWG
jgi:hypothetical protein